MKSRNSRLRTADVARRAGYSVQQIRNLEREGVIPAAERTPSGYRAYTERHVLSVRAYRALAAAVGPVEAKNIMRHSPDGRLLESLDAAHARLHAERQGLRLAQEAAEAIAREPVGEVRPSDSMTISELAGALGVRPSALRHWEAEGLITASRTPAGRVYDPAAVREARIVHQLRQAGYRIPRLRALVPQLRFHAGAGGGLAAREAGLNARSRCLIEAAALLHELLE